MNKGKLIVLEGLDGSGKSLQTENLRKRLEENGLEVQTLHFPEYNSYTGKIIKDYLYSEIGNIRKVKETNLLSKIIGILYSSDRGLQKDNLYSLLNNNVNVIIDRYTLSTLAYQGLHIHNQEKDLFRQFIINFEYNILQIPKPDLTIFIDVPLLHTKKVLLNKSNKDNYEIDLDFLQAVKDAYIQEISNNTIYNTIFYAGYDNVTHKVYEKYTITEDLFRLINKSLFGNNLR